MSLERATELFRLGQLSQAFQELDILDVGTAKTQTKEDHLASRVLRSKLLICQGSYEEALGLAEHMLQQVESHNLPFFTIDALLTKAEALHNLIRYEESQVALDTIKNLVSLYEEKNNEVRKRQCLLFLNQGCLYIKQDEFKNALAELEPALFIARKLKNPLHIGDIYRNMGLVYEKKGDLDQALHYYQEGLAISEKSGNLQSIASTVNNIGIVYERKGDLDQALHYYQESLAISEKLQRDLYVLAALNNIGMVYERKGDLDQALHYYQASLAISEKSGNSQSVASTLNNIGVIFKKKGELNRALVHYQRALSLMEVIGNSQSIAHYFSNIGHIYQDKGDLETALGHFQQSLAIREDIGNQQEIAIGLHNIGFVYYRMGRFAQALLHYQRGLVIQKGLDNPYYLAYLLTAKGLVYQEKGELEQALAYHQQALAIRKHVGNKQDLAWSLNSIGRVYQQKGDLERAVTYHQQALAIREEIGNHIEIAAALFDLINALLAHNLRKQAGRYAGRLHEISVNLDNKRIHMQSRLAEALLLKTSSRLKQKLHAQDILLELASGEVVDHSLTVLTLLNLCDLLLLEIHSSGAKEPLEDLKGYLQRLNTLAAEQHSYALHAQTYTLQAQLALIELDLDQARILLNQAQGIAEAQGLLPLAVEISDQYDRLWAQSEVLEALAAKNASLAERMAPLQVGELLHRFLLHQRAQSIKAFQEEPIALVIFSRSGESLFARPLQPGKPLDPRVINSFFVTISAVSKHIFKEKGTIERFKLKDHILAFKSVNQVYFCYIFRGSSYAALHKLKTLIQVVQTHPPLWQHLSGSHPSLNAPQRRVLGNIVKELFGSEQNDAFVEINEAEPEMSHPLMQNQPELLSTALLEFKQLLHPLRLAIMRLLYLHFRLPITQLKELLGVSWGRLQHHVKELVREEFIISRHEFIETAPRVVLYLRAKGSCQYQELQKLLQAIFSSADSD